LDQPRTYAKHASASPPAELVVDDRAGDDYTGRARFSAPRAPTRRHTSTMNHAAVAGKS